MSAKLSSWLDGFLTGEIVITDPGVWHYRWYRYWEKKTGGNPDWYRENLCHYVRVLLIWAPWNWFKFENLFLFIRPWVISYLVVLALPVYSVFSSAEYPLNFWQGAAALLLYIFAAAGVLFVAYNLDNDDDAEEERQDGKERSTLWFIRVISPIMMIFIAIYLAREYGWPMIKKGVVQIWNMVFDPWLGDLARWYFHWPILLRWITPFKLTLAGGLIFMAVFLRSWLVSIAVILLIIAMLIFFMWSINKGVDALKKYLHRGSRPSTSSKMPSGPSRRERLADSLRLAMGYVAAKKKRICPYIVLPTK